MTIHVLIVDDEPFVRADLRELLGEHDDVVVEAEAATLAACEVALTEKSFDLVFLDVQLRDCTGFDVIPLLSPQVEVVFVTAFDRYAVRAFEVNALDYLVKPVDPRRLATALERARQRLGDREIPPPTGRLERADRVLLKTDSERRFVQVRDIAVVTALGGNYTEIGLVSGGPRPTVRRALKNWEETLPPSLFVRIHRNAIVNVERVVRVTCGPDGSHEVHLQGQPEVYSISRRNLADFTRRLG